MLQIHSCIQYSRRKKSLEFCAPVHHNTDRLTTSCSKRAAWGTLCLIYGCWILIDETWWNSLAWLSFDRLCEPSCLCFPQCCWSGATSRQPTTAAFTPRCWMSRWTPGESLDLLGVKGWLGCGRRGTKSRFSWRWALALHSNIHKNAFTPRVFCLEEFPNMPMTSWCAGLSVTPLCRWTSVWRKGWSTPGSLATPSAELNC